MKISNCKLQITNLRVLVAIGLACFCAEARGDGGTLQISQQCGNLQVSVFTSPAVLRAGLIDVSVLVQDAKTKQIRGDLSVRIRLERVDGAAIPLQENATTDAATNRLFKAVRFDVPKAGTWHVTVSLPETNVEPLTFDIEVATPPPPWLQLSPWVGWPFAFVAVFLVHQKLAASRGRAFERLR
jgi:hypothetical protein